MGLTFDILNIGTKIELIKLNDEEEIGYPSQVLDIIVPEGLIVSGPIKKNNLIFMHKGEKIKVAYNVEDKGMHYFIAEIMSRNYSPIYSLRLKKISEIKKKQLREYYRLLTTLKIDKEYVALKNGIEEILIEDCRISDISGGGMRLYCNYKHDLEDKVVCKFKIQDYPIEVKALIVRIEELDSFNYKYSIGVSFSELNEEVREEIIKYIFEQQRILRVRGLI